MSEFSHLTDDELLARLQCAPELSPCTLELMGRLERALDEIDCLTQGNPDGDDSRVQSESKDQGDAGGQGYLAFSPGA